VITVVFLGVVGGYLAVSGVVGLGVSSVWGAGWWVLAREG
jgi:hypothetical protein